MRPRWKAGQSCWFTCQRGCRLGAVWVAGALALGGCGGPPEPGQPIESARVIGGLGDTPGRFAFPRAIDVSADGKTLWVIDKSARVQRIDPVTGRCLALFRMPQLDLGKPTGFCVAPGRDESGKWCDELLYIADTHYNRVMVYRPPVRVEGEGRGGEATLVARFGEYGQGPGQFMLPTDVAVLLNAAGDAVERVYVSEYGGNDRISVFDGEYRFLFSFGRWGMGSESEAIDPANVVFARPQSLLIEELDGAKVLVVTDSANHRLGRLTLEGKLIGWYGSPETMGDQPGHFRFPYGLASLHDGTVMVSEFGGGRVQRIDVRTGESLGSWGRAGRGEGELAEPWALAVLGAKVYVVDSANNRLVAFGTPRRRSSPRGGRLKKERGGREGSGGQRKG